MRDMRVESASPNSNARQYPVVFPDRISWSHYPLAKPSGNTRWQISVITAGFYPIPPHFGVRQGSRMPHF